MHAGQYKPNSFTPHIKEGINMLGFTFYLTETGKVIKIINAKNVKHERRKLARLSKMVKSGTITRDKFDECYNSWKAHASLGNSYKLLRKMDEYIEDLFKEDKEG